MNVYFDESGNTGSNLSSIDQPVYVLASHNIPEDLASDYLNDTFGENRRQELKYTDLSKSCLLYTSPSPRDATLSRMPSSA